MPPERTAGSPIADWRAAIQSAFSCADCSGRQQIGVSEDAGGDAAGGCEPVDVAAQDLAGDHLRPAGLQRPVAVSVSRRRLVAQMQEFVGAELGGADAVTPEPVVHVDLDEVGRQDVEGGGPAGRVERRREDERFAAGLVGPEQFFGEFAPGRVQGRLRVDEPAGVQRRGRVDQIRRHRREQRCVQVDARPGGVGQALGVAVPQRRIPARRVAAPQRRDDRRQMASGAGGGEFDAVGVAGVDQLVGANGGGRVRRRVVRVRDDVAVVVVRRPDRTQQHVREAHVGQSV